MNCVDGWELSIGGGVFLPRFIRVDRLPEGIVTVDCRMAGQRDVSNDYTPTLIRRVLEGMRTGSYFQSTVG